MIEIQLNNISIKAIAFTQNFEDDCELFLDFMNKIDENEIASFSLNIGEFNLTMDFSYDFLSIYNFLEYILCFVNDFKNVNVFKDLLFYERGDSKLRFMRINDDIIDVKFIKNEEILGQQFFSTLEVNKIFQKIITRFSELKLFFLFSDNNFLRFETWINSISKELSLNENGDI